MSNAYHEIAFTPPVMALQTLAGSRDAYAQQGARPEGRARLTAAETDFIAARDGFFIASVSETGWPYVQFRGGPPGFVRALEGGTLGWADFRGNQQFITTGNVASETRASLFMMDYPNRRRLKIYGHLRFRDAAEDPEFAAHLAVPGYPGRVERIAEVGVTAFDWNCPQHITPRFTLAELAALGGD